MAVPARRHRPQQALGDDLRLDRYLLLHPDFLRYVKNRCEWKARKGPGPPHPCGLLTVGGLGYSTGS